MNEGQFVAITERLERIIELLEAQAVAVVAVEPKAAEDAPKLKRKPAKQTRAAKKKGK